MEVLRSESEIDQARVELRRRGLSDTRVASSWWQRIVRRLGVAKGIDVFDPVKSWDVLKTANFIEKNIANDASILDIGAYASEIPCVLHRLNYSNLTGIDLDPQIKLMPYANTVRYEVADFMHTPFANTSFEVLTAISVIEHGFNGQRLLAEVSRLLHPGGYFIASFDYWPEKIDTEGIKYFGMDWKIFSHDDVVGFINLAAEYGLFPVGEMNYDAKEKVIDCGGRQYTFGWLVLQKECAPNVGQH